jgi:hypothetical protein
MRIFISYADEDSSTAETIELELTKRGHQVFLAHLNIGGGGDFGTVIPDKLKKSQLFIFLISPFSIEPRSFPVTELGMAQKRWRNPVGHLLPVLIDPQTSWDDIPPYARSVAVLKPRGNLAAEVAEQVQAIQSQQRRRRLAVGLAFAVSLAVGLSGGWVYRQPIQTWLQRATPQAPAMVKRSHEVKARIFVRRGEVSKNLTYPVPGQIGPVTGKPTFAADPDNNQAQIVDLVVGNEGKSITVVYDLPGDGEKDDYRQIRGTVVWMEAAPQLSPSK